MEQIAQPTFPRLSLADQDEILDLLSTTWPKLYGKTGCPVFSAEYLDWLYGGPDADRHLLMGCRDTDGRLIGFKAALYRPVLVEGEKRSAHIASHLAIDPDLPFGQRIKISGEMSRLHTLIDDPSSLNLAFFEAEKALVRNTRNAARKAGLSVAEVPFQQFVVNRRRLMAAAPEEDKTSIRPAVEQDAAALATALCAQSKDKQLNWSPDAAQLWHHMSAAPKALCLSAERDGKIVGGLGGYVLDWIKDDQTTQMFICDVLTADQPDTLNHLLRAAYEHIQSIGLRGLVLENATCIPPEFQSAGGLLKTHRTMILAIRTQQPLTFTPDGFNFDVK